MATKHKKSRGPPHRRIIEMKEDVKFYGKVAQVSIFDTITPIIIGLPPNYKNMQGTKSKSSLQMMESASLELVPTPPPLILLPPLILIPPPNYHLAQTILAVTYISVRDSSESVFESVFDSICKRQRVCAN